MNQYFKQLHVNTNRQSEMIDITASVKQFVEDSGVENGMIIINVLHTTAAVTINENADEDVKTDIIHGLNKISPMLKEYQHFEGNSDAHIKSSLIGTSETIIIGDKKLQLGVWQGIYFCEFDGPRNRTINLQIISI